MNRRELKARLDAAGVSEGDYILEGVDSSARGLVEGGTVLTSDGDHWVVSVEERGVSRIDGVFATEDEACDYIYQQLTYRPPIGPPLTPDEVDRAKSLRDELVAEHRRWVEEHEKKPGGTE
jgi:hypothetical protein